MMNKVKIIVNYLFSFGLSLLISLLVSLLLCKYLVLDKSYVNNVILNNNYYQKIYNEINEQMKDSMVSSGFSEEILDNIFTKEEVEDDINKYVDSIYSGDILSLNKDNIKEQLNKNIDEFLEKSNLKLEKRDEVDAFIFDMVTIYKNEICLYNYLDGIIVKIPHFIKIIDMLITVVAVLIFIIILILKIWVRKTYTSSSFVASGLILLFIRLFVFEKVDMDNILMITEEFSSIIKHIAYNYEALLFKISIGLILFGFILICKNSTSKKKEENKLLK